MHTKVQVRKLNSHSTALLYSNIDQTVKNMYKLIIIVNIYRFNLLSKAVIIYIETLNRSQKEAITLVYAFIKSLNLFKIQKVLKKDSTFKIFTIKYI